MINPEKIFNNLYWRGFNCVSESYDSFFHQDFEDLDRKEDLRQKYLSEAFRVISEFFPKRGKIPFPSAHPSTEINRQYKFADPGEPWYIRRARMQKIAEQQTDPQLKKYYMQVASKIKRD